MKRKKFFFVVLFILGMLSVGVSGFLSNWGPAFDLGSPGRYCFPKKLIWKADGYSTQEGEIVFFSPGEPRKLREGHTLKYSFWDVPRKG